MYIYVHIYIYIYSRISTRIHIYMKKIFAITIPLVSNNNIKNNRIEHRNSNQAARHGTGSKCD